MDLRQEAMRWAQRDEKPKRAPRNKTVASSISASVKAGLLFGVFSMGWQAALSAGFLAGWGLPLASMAAIWVVKPSVASIWREKSFAVFPRALAARTRLGWAENKQTQRVVVAMAADAWFSMAKAAVIVKRKKLGPLAWANRALAWRGQARARLGVATDNRNQAADDAAIAIGPRSVWMAASLHLANGRPDRAATLFLAAPFDPRWPCAVAKPAQASAGAGSGAQSFFAGFLDGPRRTFARARRSTQMPFADALAHGVQNADQHVRSSEERMRKANQGAQMALALRDGIELNLDLLKAKKEAQLNPRDTLGASAARASQNAGRNPASPKSARASRGPLFFGNAQDGVLDEAKIPNLPSAADTGADALSRAPESSASASSPMKKPRRL